MSCLIVTLPPFATGPEMRLRVPLRVARRRARGLFPMPDGVIVALAGIVAERRLKIVFRGGLLGMFTDRRKRGMRHCGYFLLKIR